MAILFAIKSFDIERSTHVKKLCDNTTAEQIINNKGSSHSKDCNNISFLIWQAAIEKDMFITASHLPGILNKKADIESRKHESRTMDAQSSYFQQSDCPF